MTHLERSVKYVSTKRIDMAKAKVESTMSAREKFILQTSLMTATAGMRQLCDALERITKLSAGKPKPLPQSKAGRKRGRK